MSDIETEALERDQTVMLTGRDIEDARRLLCVLSTAAEQQATIAPPAPGERDRSAADLLAKAREILANRRRRLRFFDGDMFSERAWEMLLHLYALEAGARQNVTRIAKLSGTSKTTALRWIDYLEKHALVRRTAHPTDRRVSFVELTRAGKRNLEAYLSEVVESPR